MVTTGEIVGVLGQRFPWELAEGWDNCGLQAGSFDTRVRGICCTLDADCAAIELAAEAGCNLLVTHHPMILEPVRSVDTSCPGGRSIGTAIGLGVDVVSCHTNADCAPGGTADLMAGAIGAVPTGPLEPAGGAKILKVAVYVPPGSSQGIARSMFEAGGGVIGRYSHCSFCAGGYGTFLPGPGTSPHEGQEGVLSRVEEERIEMVVPSFRLDPVIRAMKAAHPYEEPAFDVYPTLIPVPWGAGRIAVLSPGVSAAEVVRKLEGSYRCDSLVIRGDRRREYSRVALVPGSANSMVGAACRSGADLMITGELNYHAVMEAEASGMALMMLGHAESELPIVEETAGFLREAGRNRGWGIRVETPGKEGG